MTRTLADTALSRLAIALMCGLAACAWAPMTSGLALADTGGSSVPPGWHPAQSGSSSNRSAKSASSHSRTAKSSSKTKTLPKEQIATWFGPGFYGQKTACGQTLTPKTVGVASRTLPCGTLVDVDYKGHRLTVPVIDRGPYAHNGATWDLTWGAASALSIEGTVRIETKVVGHTPNTPLLGEPTEATATPASVTVTPSGGTSAS